VQRLAISGRHSSYTGPERGGSAAHLSSGVVLAAAGIRGAEVAASAVDGYLDVKVRCPGRPQQPILAFAARSPFQQVIDLIIPVI
jgi:hypothetical protein